MCSIDDEDEIAPYQPQRVHEFVNQQNQGFEVVLKTFTKTEERRERNDLNVRKEFRQIFEQQIEKMKQNFDEDRKRMEAEREELKEEIKNLRKEISELKENHPLEIKKVELKNDEIFWKVVPFFAIGFVFGMMLKFSHLSIIIFLLVSFIAYKLRELNVKI